MSTTGTDDRDRVGEQEDGELVELVRRIAVVMLRLNRTDARGKLVPSLDPILRPLLAGKREAEGRIEALDLKIRELHQWGNQGWAQLASANAERDQARGYLAINAKQLDAANARVEGALAGKLGIDRLDHSGAPCSLGGENLSALPEGRETEPKPCTDECKGCPSCWPLPDLPYTRPPTARALIGGAASSQIDQAIGPSPGCPGAVGKSELQEAPQPPPVNEASDRPKPSPEGPHVVTWWGLLQAQVCSTGTWDQALDHICEAMPAGTSGNWSKSEEFPPVPCRDFPGRTHYMFVC